MLDPPVESRAFAVLVPVVVPMVVVPPFPVAVPVPIMVVASAVASPDDAPAAAQQKNEG